MNGGIYTIQWVILIVILLTGSGFGYRAYRRRRSTTLSGNSILLSYYTEGAILVPVEQGKIGDMKYTAIVITGGVDGALLAPNMALLYRVELPFITKVHLLGIPKEGTVQLEPSASKGMMEEVVLEGDYPNYFRLFSETGMQTQSRYVMDPKAMVFTVDFCRSHNWEIVNSELYFLQTSDNHPDDPTYMHDDVDQFVKEIRPAIARPLSPEAIRLRTPYGIDRRKDLKCPVCGRVMLTNEKMFACPDGHGFLITGKALLQIRKGTVTLPALNGKKPMPRNEGLVCPSCGATMHHVNYDGGPTEIDSCTKCHYRWLDSGDRISSPER